MNSAIERIVIVTGEAGLLAENRQGAHLLSAAQQEGIG